MRILNTFLTFISKKIKAYFCCQTGTLFFLKTIFLFRYFYRKLIGARYYTSEKSIDSARDADGHGTHTASIAAGNHVKGASFYGLAQGTARGGVPSARIAAYRACDAQGACQEADVLAAFDDAIADGVDIISISLAYSNNYPSGQFSIEVGAFHAMERGILTVAAAGNSGSSPGTIDDSMPWMLSVAASTIDRRFIDKLVLGNGKTLIVYIFLIFQYFNFYKVQLPL